MVDYSKFDKMENEIKKEEQDALNNSVHDNSIEVSGYFHYIYYNTVLEYVKRSTVYSKNLVSVGSGYGEMEYIIKQKIENIKLYCIDPCPSSFNHKVKNCLLPDYDTVDDLLQNNKHLIKNCTLLLFWPIPNNNKVNYDFKAIMTLKPNAIVLLYDPIGSAGSADLHHWIEMNDAKLLQGDYNINLPQEKIETILEFSKSTEYRQVQYYINEIKPKPGLLIRATIALIIRKDLL